MNKIYKFILKERKKKYPKLYQENQFNGYKYPKI